MQPLKYEIVKPTLLDVKEMENLVFGEVEKGVILARSEDEIANAIRSYKIVKIDDADSPNRYKTIGFSALHIHSKILAEVRSLIVDSRFQNRGVGRALVSSLIDEAKMLGVEEVLTLTYRDSFFKKMGFEVISKDRIPNHKIWADCIKCKHFPVCDEIALIKKL